MESKELLTDLGEFFKIFADPTRIRILELLTEEECCVSEIVEKLNFLILRNATDEVLVKVAKNIMNKIPASILNGEYHYFSLNDMIKGIMFDGIDVTPEVSERIEKLIDEEFPVIKEGRNLA